MTLEVSSSALARVLGNVLLFVDDESRYLPAQILLVGHGHTISAYSCDDYVAATDSCDIDKQGDLGVSFECVLTRDSAEELRKLAAATKDLKRTPGFVELFDNEGTWMARDITKPTEIVSFPVELPNHIWDAVINWFDDTDYEDSTDRIIALRPERFAKLFRVKAPKECPIDVRFIKSEDKALNRLAIRNGPTFRAIISATVRDIARDAVTEAGLNPEVCLW